MDKFQILLNLGYLLTFTALSVRDILWLRVLLVSTQLSFFSYGLITQNKTVIFWNSLFLIINSYRLVRLIQERRPIDLPPELIDLYEKVFSSMRRREFWYLWHIGRRRTVKDRQIIRKGERQRELMLITAGKVEVNRDGTLLAELTRGSFIAEMSFLTGEGASADVFARGEVQYMAWEQEKIRSLQQINPDLYMKIQNILGKDLSAKIKSGGSNNQ